MRSIASAGLLLLVVLVSLLGSHGGRGGAMAFEYSDDHHHLKCSACQAIVEEIGHRMNESRKIRSSVKTSHRLVGDKQRVDYESSELRAVEILEGLCKHVETTYELKIDNATGLRIFSKNASLEASVDHYNKADKRAVFAFGRKLGHYCATVVDEHDDTIVSMIRNLRALHQLEDELCVKAVKHCSGPVVERCKAKELAAKEKLRQKRDKGNVVKEGAKLNLEDPDAVPEALRMAMKMDQLKDPDAAAAAAEDF